MSRVDLIVGQITGPVSDSNIDTNPTTQVVARYGPNDWKRRGDTLVMRHTLRDVETDTYVRVRGTNTDEMEPLPDADEDPWSDLWFYSNPVFIQPTDRTVITPGQSTTRDDTYRHCWISVWSTGRACQRVWVSRRMQLETFLNTASVGSRLRVQRQ